MQHVWATVCNVTDDMPCVSSVLCACPSLLQASPLIHFQRSAQNPHAQVTLSACPRALGFPLWGTRILDCPTFQSATGPAAFSSEMSLEPTDSCQSLSPQWRPSPLVPGGSDWRHSGLHFPLPVLIGHRGQNVLSKRLLCACHHPAQKPPITASWAPSVLWSGTLPLPRLANLPFSIDLPLLCLLLAPARSVYSLRWVLVMNKTMVRLCQGPSLSGWDASARGLG